MDAYIISLKITKIRPGLYEANTGHMIEHLDESAERYPGDGLYNSWAVYDPDGEMWYPVHKTLKDAKVALMGWLK